MAWLKVKMMSSLTGFGLDDVTAAMEKFRSTMIDNEQWELRRAEQRKRWMWNYVNNRLLEVIYAKL